MFFDIQYLCLIAIQSAFHGKLRFLVLPYYFPLFRYKSYLDIIFHLKTNIATVIAGRIIA